MYEIGALLPLIAIMIGYGVIIVAAVIFLRAVVRISWAFDKIGNAAEKATASLRKDQP